MLVLLSVYTKDNGIGYQEELYMHKRLKWLVAATCLGFILEGRHLISKNWVK
ncbi:TPA: hypothetical protein ACGNMO_001691 [Streptococcus agalactiae]